MWSLPCDVMIVSVETKIVVHPWNLESGSSTSSPSDLELQLQILSPEPEVSSDSGARASSRTACGRDTEHDES